MQEKTGHGGAYLAPARRAFLRNGHAEPAGNGGTYPLPEAQLDRFLFKLRVPYPGRDDCMTFWTAPRRARRGGAASHKWRANSGDAPDRAHRSRRAARSGVRCEIDAGDTSGSARKRPGEQVHPLWQFPRGAQTLILGGKVRALLDGRYNVSLEDIRALMLPALRHRIILNFEAQADGRTTDDLLEEIAGKLN